MRVRTVRVVLQHFFDERVSLIVIVAGDEHQPQIQRGFSISRIKLHRALQFAVSVGKALHLQIAFG